MIVEAKNIKHKNETLLVPSIAPTLVKRLKIKTYVTFQIY